MSRHATRRSKPQKVVTGPHPRQVGHSVNQTRGSKALVLVALFFTAAYFIVSHGWSMVQSAQYLPLTNQEFDYPDRLTQAMQTCGKRPGQEKGENIPVIGEPDGIFSRVAELRVIDGVAWAGDPYSPRVNW